MEKAEIKKIVLDLGDKEVEISPKQARKLHQLLDEMYGTKDITIPAPIIIRDKYYPYWEYPTPTWYSKDSSVNIQYMANSNTAKISL